ncbi:MAG: TetR/AcrR family transcriptional regulator [Pseudomonadota bacterium]
MNGAAHTTEIPQGPRARPASERHIVNIATAMFIEHGYDDTHMADIARSCNVTLKALTEMYTDKEVLFRIVVDRESQQVRSPYENEVPHFDTAMEAVQFIAAHQKTIWETTLMPDLCRVVALAAKNHNTIDDIFRTPDGREQAQALGEHVFGVWTERGLFRPCDLAIAVRQFYGMLNQAFLFEPRARGCPIENQAKYLQHCCDIFVREYGVK